jgi:hypothetical protein
MKIPFASLRKQADYFRSRGQYKEAWDVYARFAATSTNVDSDTKSAVEEELKRIASEMNCSQAGDTPEHSDDRVDRISDGSGASTHEIESDLRLCTQDPSQVSACAQEEKTHADSPEWADGMADIHSLVTNEPGHSSSTNLEATLPDEAEPPKILLKQDLPKKNGFYHDHSFKLYLIGIATVVAVAGYSANRFFAPTSDRQHGLAQQPVTIVHKKMPPSPGNEAASFSLSSRPEDSASKQYEQPAIVGEAQVPGDPVEVQKMENSGSRPSEDFQKGATGYSEMPVAGNKDIPPSPEEPDPASAINYVLKKRGLDF